LALKKNKIMAIKLTQFKPMQQEILRLRKENALLIEALENAMDYWQVSKEDDGNFEQTEYQYFLKAKELLNNLKK